MSNSLTPARPASRPSNVTRVEVDDGRGQGRVPDRHAGARLAVDGGRRRRGQDRLRVGQGEQEAEPFAGRIDLQLGHLGGGHRHRQAGPGPPAGLAGPGDDGRLLVRELDPDPEPVRPPGRDLPRQLDRQVAGRLAEAGADELDGPELGHLARLVVGVGGQRPAGQFDRRRVGRGRLVGGRRQGGGRGHRSVLRNLHGGRERPRLRLPAPGHAHQEGDDPSVAHPGTPRGVTGASSWRCRSR